MNCLFFPSSYLQVPAVAENDIMRVIKGSQKNNNVGTREAYIKGALWG